MVEIHCAKTEIENLHLRSLTGTGTHRPTKRNADDDDDDDGNENGSEMFRSITRATQTRNVFEQAIAVGRELAKAGYLLTPGPTPVCTSFLFYQPELLCVFANQHTITLLRDMGQLSIGKVIVLPWQTPLGCVLDDLNPEQRHRTIPSLHAQFLERSRLLHDHGVAHLDLKPDNVAVNNDMLSAIPRVSITDFDTAEFITGVETVIGEQRGTTGWMAPEVVANESVYSPVLALVLL